MLCAGWRAPARDAGIGQERGENVQSAGETHSQHRHPPGDYKVHTASILPSQKGRSLQVIWTSSSCKKKNK